jgi:hypothetical protein
MVAGRYNRSGGDIAGKAEVLKQRIAHKRFDHQSWQR